MRSLSLILGLIGVFALLTLGAGGAWATPATGAPCHEMATTHHDAPAKSPAPAKATMVMACCIACVSPAVPSAPTTVPAVHPRPVQPARLALPIGRSPAPEHGPPRLAS